MVIGALVTCAFFFAYTAVRTHAANLGFTCAIYFTVNVYYGTLYAYTPEVLPSAHRATGNGIAIACNRVMGLVSAAVATSANTATSAPIYICAVLYIVMVGQRRNRYDQKADIGRRLSLLSCRSSLTESRQCEETKQVCRIQPMERDRPEAPPANERRIGWNGSQQNLWIAPMRP